MITWGLLTRNVVRRIAAGQEPATGRLQAGDHQALQRNAASLTGAERGQPARPSLKLRTGP